VQQQDPLYRLAPADAAAAGESVVPAGHVAVCVGGAAHLNHPVFRELLRQAEEEYGFPCDEGLFEHVLRHLSSPSRFVTLEDIKSGALAGCCAAAGEALPLLHQGIAADKAVW
jgi:SAUR family protein